MSVAADTTLHLSEVFGPTWQGEGPHAGRRCSFVRLGLCNLSCEWCDTPYTWDRTRFDLAAEAPLTPVEAIHARLDDIGCDMVVLSGGEPLIHHTRLRPLLDPIFEWHVETNGTIVPPGWWDRHVRHTTVSPKINTRDPEKRRLTPALTYWASRAHGGAVAFKFVVSTARDLDEVDRVVDRFLIPPRAVWIMPEGTRPGALLARHRALAEPILARGWNTTTRLHTLLWGEERGR